MRKHTLRLALVLCGLVGLGNRAEASSFTVNPIKVLLSDKEQSALLTLQNQSTEELRFKVLVQEWKQNPQGEMELADTKDIVVYPALLSLPPGGERKLRVGATVPAAGAEKSYRVFVEELPPLRSAKEATKSEVRVLTKMGIPIFIRPAKTVSTGEIEGMGMAKGKFSFAVRNTGNVHFLVQSVHVKALDSASGPAFEKDVEGWYVLAGGTRVWQVEIPKDACKRSKKLSVEVQTSEGKFDGKLDVPPSGCSP